MMSELVAIRGDTETYELALTDAAGDPYDLTGVDIWFTVKRRLSSGTPSPDIIAAIQRL
jgi:hypothetical protein